MFCFFDNKYGVFCILFLLIFVSFTPGSDFSSRTENSKTVTTSSWNATTCYGLEKITTAMLRSEAISPLMRSEATSPSSSSEATTPPSPSAESTSNRPTQSFYFHLEIAGLKSNEALRFELEFAEHARDVTGNATRTFVSR